MADPSTIVGFDGGLDLVTPVQESSPGTLSGCLNYEVGPIKGYKRIDGFEQFDGMPDGAVSNLYRIYIQTDLPDGHLLSVGSLVYREAGEFLGTVVMADSGEEYQYVPAAPGRVPVPGSNYVAVNPLQGVVSLTAISPPEDYRNLGLSPEDYAEVIRIASFVLRSAVVPAPAVIAGAYHGRSRAYAVLDCARWDWTNASTSWEIGQWYRHNGIAYMVVGQDGLVINMLRMPHPQVSPSSVFERLSYNNLITGTGNIGTVDDVLVLYDDAGSRYAQPYALPSVEDSLSAVRQYTPIAPSYVFTYSDGEEAFDSFFSIDVGTETVGFTVIDYTVDSGSFDTNDASGLVYAKLDSADSAWDGEIPDSSDLIMEGNVVGSIVGFYAPLWAGTKSLRNERLTHYLWGTYNFRATRGRDNIYCTNGKTRAGWIEDTDTPVFGNVVTQVDLLLDTPKYLTFHAGQRLGLGFANGSAQLSAVGRPLNFSGFEGAVEIGNGDNITGMLEASGDSTFLFGPRTIRRIVGEGDSLALKTISTSGGAFDYTAVVAAGVPLYVNQNGICSLDQTSAYGDFKNSSLSGAIDPWFTPRIVQDSSSIDLGGVVCAIPVRDKNQYRIFLGDGNVVNLSLTVTGAKPTISNYAIVEHSLRIPLAFSSSVSDKGEEFILVAWDRARAAEGDRGVVVDLPDDQRIYRLDKGWGFNGLTFDHHIDTSYMFNEEPTFMSITKAVLYGLGYGYTKLRLQASGVEDNFEKGFELTVQDISMPRSPEVMYKTLQRVMGVVDHANWGRTIRLRFSNITPSGTENTEPMHILQSVRLFVQTDGISE